MVKAVPNQYDKLVAAGLQDLVLLPESDGYKERQASYWAANAPLRPTCIVQPRNTEEVSRVIRVLAEADGSVALHSGGHTQWAGSNDIHDGVTIDMGRMTEVTYDEETKLASVQPGPRWVDVYRKLLVYRVCVTGGREGNVGVAGFLTGGGNSYHASLHGFGCDNIANFEIVLADGKVINANANSHSDLWTALKGGSGNFGIVTRFDMYTFSAQDVWCGIRTSIRSHGDDLARMLVDFTNNNHNNPQAALLVLYTFNVAMSPDVIVVQSITDTSGVLNAPAFEKISKVPVVMDDVKKRSMADAVATYNQPKGDQWVWFTLTFKNDIRIVRKASEMHDYLVDELRHLIPPANFTTQCIFQPLPTLFAERSMRRGGNILGLDQVKDNAFLWAIIGSTKTTEESTIMRKKLTNFSATVERFAREYDLNVDWRYLNYADETQDPLQSYGQINVDFMRSVARKYDPHGVFQKKVISGWKISKVGSQHAEHRQDDLSGTML